MSRCELFLDEHQGDLPCGDAAHEKALANRAGGAAEWRAIKRSSDAGGDRDFLDRRPIHCGSSLLLQSIQVKSDDYGEYAVRLETGTRVRYELGLLTETDGRRQIVLYVEIGGHLFEKPAHPFMRFRWPEERR